MMRLPERLPGFLLFLNIVIDATKESVIKYNKGSKDEKFWLYARRMVLPVYFGSEQQM